MAESPFVDDVGVAGVVKKTGGDPRLRYEHSQTPNLMETSAEGGTRTIEK